MRLPVLIVVFCYLFLLATDFLIIWDFRKMSLYNKFAPENKKPGLWWKIYTVFAALVLIEFTVAVSLPHRGENADITGIMWLLYIFFSVLISQIIYSIFSLSGYILLLFKKPRVNTGLWIGLPLACLVFTSMWWGALVGRKRIEVVDVEISSSRLPRSFNGYKIAQISDLHVGTWGKDTTFLSRLVDSVNGLHPDMIVFTGDIVNKEASELTPFVTVLSRLHAPDGVYSILGNHDYGDYVDWESPQMKAANLEALKASQKKMGWKMLNNSHVAVKNTAGDSIILIGVENWGEPPFSQYGDLSKAYPASRFYDNNFKVLLSHNPKHWSQIVSKTSNIDLTLAGHTHAMQIMLSVGKWKWSPSKFKYDQWGGLYPNTEGNGEEANLYVNIGAGEVGLPMRIGASPEITLITLHSR